MATSTILAMIVSGMSLLLHLLPSSKSKDSSTPATPATPATPTDTSSDAFSGLPGLPGHPLLNRLFRKRAEQEATSSLADLIKADPTSMAQIVAALQQK